MTEVFVGWGDGTLKHNGKKITQFATEDLRIIPQYTKSKTSRIFFFHNFMYFLSDKGEVIRKQEGVKEPENLKFQHKSEIKKMKKGNNHILFLDNKGLVHSLGNNYYGQLGLGNNMLTYQNYPICIDYFLNNKIVIEKIHICKNTSFAIDKSNKLFVWGSSEFIPNYYSNFFSPKQIFIEYKIFNISHNDNKISVKYKKLSDDEIDQIKFRERELKKKNSKIKKSMFSNKEENEEDDEEDLSKDEDYIEEKSGNPFLQLNNVLNDIFKLFEKKSLNESFDDKIKQAKNFIDKQSTFIMTDNSHPEILKVKDLNNEFYDREFIDDKKLKKSVKSIKSLKNINNDKKEWYNYPFEDEKFKKKKEEFDDYVQKEFNKAESLTEYKKIISKEYSNFLPFTFKLKQLERVVYKIGLNKLILKTYEMENVKEALKEVYKKNNNSIGKNKIILSKINVVDKIINSFDEQSKKFGTFFDKLMKMKNTDINDYFIFKHIIESSLNLKTLIKNTMETLKNENQLREEINLMINKLEIFKEINNLKIYLEKIDFSFIIEDKEKKESFQEKMKKTLFDCYEIDGIINRLILIKQNLLDPHYPIKEKVLKEICLIFLWSVLETAYMKKAIWELMFNIYNNENKNI